MTTLACDASTFILLAKAGLLEMVASKNMLIIPPQAHGEITAGREKGASEAFIMEKLLLEKKIEVREPRRAAEIEKIFHLRGAERDVLALALELKIGMLCDDKKAINACKVCGVPFTTALNIAEQSAKTRGRTKALDAIDKLHRFGWYAEELIESARTRITGGRP